MEEEEKDSELRRAVNSQVQNGFQARQVVNYTEGVEGVGVRGNEGELFTKTWHIF